MDGCFFISHYAEYNIVVEELYGNKETLFELLNWKPKQSLWKYLYMYSIYMDEVNVFTAQSDFLSSPRHCLLQRMRKGGNISSLIFNIYVGRLCWQNVFMKCALKKWAVGTMYYAITRGEGSRYQSEGVFAASVIYTIVTGAQLPHSSAEMKSWWPRCQSICKRRQVHLSFGPIVLPNILRDSALTE